jgi:lysine 2,3-aminomutase
LSAFTDISRAAEDRWRDLLDNYPYAVTPYYLGLADLDNPDDPILRQCLPDPVELDSSPMADEDPLAEEKDSPVQGLIHRYPDRALIITTNRCAVYCRHCNRKRYWKNGESDLSSEDFDRIVSYIGEHANIREVIFSGGDPLLLSAIKLEKMLSRITAIEHIQMVRIHTRVPVVLPQRIDETLARLLAGFRPLWIVTQFNHPNEITPVSAVACTTLIESGLPLLNQGVLLKGINDEAVVIEQLVLGLTRLGVRPYYLFECDPVKGVEHLRTPVSRGVDIINYLRGRIGGYAIPQFAVDLPGGGGKVTLTPEYLIDSSPGKLIFKNFRGETISYPDPASD